MASDKTIISLPTIKKVQFAPNTAQAFSELTYNEGLYIKKDSTSSTYPKSVVRIYKNNNNPKKIYVLSKDSTILQATSKYYASASTKPENEIINWNSLSNYVSSEYFDRYSKFSQPENFNILNFDDSSLQSKTVNFYSFTVSSIQNIFSLLQGELVPSLTVNGLTNGTNESSDLDPTNTLGSYLLKSKSIVADYYNDNEQYVEKELNIFNGALYAYWFDKSITNKQLASLTENDLLLYNSTKIKKTKSIDFSEYVDKKYNNVWIQKIDRAIESDAGTGQTYIISQEDTTKSEDDSNRWSPLYSFSEEIGGKNPFLDGTSLDYLINKYVFIQKNDFILNEYSTERELFTLNENVPFSSYDRTFSDGGVKATYSYNGALKRVQKLIFNTEYNIFIPDKAWVEEYFEGSTIDKKARQSPLNYLKTDTDRVEQFSEYLQPIKHLSNLYVLNESYQDQRNNLGQLFPDNPENTIVYEIELENEIDFENGSFVVMEIE